MGNTKGLERLNKKRKRCRLGYPDIFKPARYLRLVSALLAEQNDEWAAAQLKLITKS